MSGARQEQSAPDIWVQPLTGDRKPYPFVNGDYAERLGLFSPDGRWVAYESLESGRAEIYIRPFPGPAGPSAEARQWQVSTAGGAGRRWRKEPIAKTPMNTGVFSGTLAAAMI